MLIFLTDFADQSVVLPMVAMVAVVLMVQRRWRVAAMWLFAVSGVLGTVLALKVVGYACSWLLPALGSDRLALRSPSGHTAAAAVTYGGMAALLAARTKFGAVQVASAAVLTAMGVAALIGFTRVQLGVHSPSEVIVAASIGVVSVVGFARLVGQAGTGQSGTLMLTGALFVLVLAHGRHLPAEAAIQDTMANTLRRLVTVCEPKQGETELADTLSRHSGDLTFMLP